VCATGSEAVFAVYSDVEGFDEAEGAGYDMEEDVSTLGLAVLSNDIIILICSLYNL